MNDIKICPFCGNKSIEFYSKEFYNQYKNRRDILLYMKCDLCKANGPMKSIEADKYYNNENYFYNIIINSWNGRIEDNE